MEMTKEQLELIANQLATIKERSPFYAKKFEGIDVADVRTQADFEKLPFPRKMTCARCIRWGCRRCPTRKSCASTAPRAPRGRTQMSCRRTGCRSRCPGRGG